MRILGIDPGSQRTGVGIIEVDPQGKLGYLHHCTVQLLDDADFPSRLKRIFDEITDCVNAWRPAEIAIEKVFMSRNADSALKLGQARGAAICAVVCRGLAVNEYAAKEVKQAVVGRGAADKNQVQHMVKVLLGYPGALQADAGDALAVAVTHAHVRSTTARIGIPRKSWRRR